MQLKITEQSVTVSYTEVFNLVFIYINRVNVFLSGPFHRMLF